MTVFEKQFSKRKTFRSYFIEHQQQFKKDIERRERFQTFSLIFADNLRRPKASNILGGRTAALVMQEYVARHLLVKAIQPKSVELERALPWLKDQEI